MVVRLEEAAMVSLSSSCVCIADGERLGEVTDPGRRPAVAQAVARQRKAEDSSESHEEEQVGMSEPWWEQGGMASVKVPDLCSLQTCG